MSMLTSLGNRLPDTPFSVQDRPASSRFVVFIFCCFQKTLNCSYRCCYCDYRWASYAEKNFLALMVTLSDPKIICP